MKKQAIIIFGIIILILSIISFIVFIPRNKKASENVSNKVVSNIINAVEETEEEEEIERVEIPKEDKHTVEVNFTINNSNGSTTINYDSSWFFNDSKDYNHDISKLCSQILMLGYDVVVEDEENLTGNEYTILSIKSALEELGFKNIEINPVTGRDEVNYFIAQKEISSENKKYNFIFCGLMRSYYNQWYSNFDPYGYGREANDGNGYAGNNEKGIVHLGFADARDFVYQKLCDYINKYNSKYETKILITGHSRGGATANLLSKKILESEKINNLKIKKENVFSYTYAAPNVAKITDEDRENITLKRIFNIVNPEDFCTRVLPANWGFGKYGTTYILPSQSNNENYDQYLSNMQEYYVQFCENEQYYPYYNGTQPVDNIINMLAEECIGIDEFYTINYELSGEEMTVYEFFQTTLIPIAVAPKLTDEDEDKSTSAKFKMALAATTIKTSDIYSKTSQFLIESETLYPFFSQSHKILTYCAYMMSMSGEDFK